MNEPSTPQTQDTTAELLTERGAALRAEGAKALAELNDKAAQVEAQQCFSYWEKTGELPIMSPAGTSELRRRMSLMVPKLTLLWRELLRREAEQEEA